MGGAGETADDEVAAWLRSVHLERYTQALAELGYERLNFFRGIDADELSELMETVQMARPHRRVFSDALAQIDGRTGASAPGGSAAAAATLSPHQQQAPQAAVLAQQPSGIRTVAGAGPLSPSAPPLEAALLPVSGGFSTTTQSSSGSGRARAPPLSLQQGRRPKQPLCDRRRMGRAHRCSPREAVHGHARQPVPPWSGVPPRQQHRSHQLPVRIRLGGIAVRGTRPLLRSQVRRARSLLLDPGVAQRALRLPESLERDAVRRVLPATHRWWRRL